MVRRPLRVSGGHRPDEHQGQFDRGRQGTPSPSGDDDCEKKAQGRRRLHDVPGRDRAGGRATAAAAADGDHKPGQQEGVGGVLQADTEQDAEGARGQLWLPTGHCLNQPACQAGPTRGMQVRHLMRLPGGQGGERSDDGEHNRCWKQPRSERSAHPQQRHEVRRQQQQEEQMARVPASKSTL